MRWDGIGGDEGYGLMSECKGERCQNDLRRNGLEGKTNHPVTPLSSHFTSYHLFRAPSHRNGHSEYFPSYFKKRFYVLLVLIFADYYNKKKVGCAYSNSLK
jgi:hypothetical protein